MKTLWTPWRMEHLLLPDFQELLSAENDHE